MKISVDTNVLVRAVMGDDLTQARIATQVLTDAKLIAVALPRTYALTAARNCGVKCSLPGMKPVTKAATTWVNNSVFHW